SALSSGQGFATSTKGRRSPTRLSPTSAPAAHLPATLKSPDLKSLAPLTHTEPRRQGWGFLFVLSWPGNQGRQTKAALDPPHDDRDACVSTNCVVEQSRNASSLRDDNFQIFARRDHGAVVRSVHTRNKGVQVVFETVLLGLIERRERLEHRAVIGSQHLQEVLG